VARPRQFQEEAVLEEAMKLFWQRGYDGLSMDELCAALGLSKPSLYGAFGNKRALYSRALARYWAQVSGRAAEAFSHATLREAVRAFWELHVQGDPELRGCFLVQSSAACSEPDVPREAAGYRRQSEKAIARRIERAAAEEELGPVHAADLARYVNTVANGLSVLRAGGASAAECRRVADLALAAIPAPRRRK
jgi:AcrR family transcriptional regulator